MKYLLILLLAVLALGDYTPKTALDLAYFSEIAYERLTHINAWNCSSCARFKISDIKAFQNNTWDMQGFVAYSLTHSAIIVAFRGSSNVKNWIDDFDATHTAYSKCSGCNVHKGFYMGYKTVSSTVKSQITTLASKYRNAPIYITGHSLGGALAVVAALDIHQTFGNVEKLYTYGQPRVGNTAFAAYVFSQVADSFRVIHYEDIVPHVPTIAMDYRHHNYEVWYQKDMKSYKVCNAEDPTCSDSVSPTKWNAGDHDISNYLKIATVQTNLRRMFERALGLIALA